jgi:transcription elongation factor GreB
MKNYLTPEGYHRLRDELSSLVKVERPKVVHQVSEAAAMGDRSENAEYIYGKRRLREIDRRIHFLEGRLEDVEIVDPQQVSLEKVSFGVWVDVVNDAGEKQSLQIVGEDELDPTRGKITFTSPVGRALLGKRIGDVVVVKVPKGEMEYEILNLRRA